MTHDEILAQSEHDYMSDAQLKFFRDLLLSQRDELQQRIDGEFQVLKAQEPSSDPSDIGTAEEQRGWNLRILEREKKLLDKMDEALERIAKGEYGWCEETGEPIGIKRLLARPTATLSFEAKERRELQERHQRSRRNL